MPTKTYTLGDGSANQIEISWQHLKLRTDYTIKHNHDVLGTLTLKDLKKGQEFILPDNSILIIIVGYSTKGDGSDGFIVSCDGKLLPGSYDPIRAFKTACNFIWLVAIVNVALGILGSLGLMAGFGILDIIFGIVFGVSGVFASRKSRIALATASLLFVASTLYSVSILLSTNHGFGNGLVIAASIFIRMLLSILLVRVTMDLPILQGSVLSAPGSTISN